MRDRPMPEGSAPRLSFVACPPSWRQMDPTPPPAALRPKRRVPAMLVIPARPVLPLRPPRPAWRGLGLARLLGMAPPPPRFREVRAGW